MLRHCQSGPERLRQPCRHALVRRTVKVDNDKTEWKYVAKGTCKQMKGLTMDKPKPP